MLSVVVVCPPCLYLLKQNIPFLLTCALPTSLWKVHQWDFVGAYLQAPLQHSIYVNDIIENGETKYWKLHKALYGLAARASWTSVYDMLTDFCRYVGDEGLYQYLPYKNNNSVDNSGVSLRCSSWNCWNWSADLEDLGLLDELL